MIFLIPYFFLLIINFTFYSYFFSKKTSLFWLGTRLHLLIIFSESTEIFNCYLNMWWISCCISFFLCPKFFFAFCVACTCSSTFFYLRQAYKCCLSKLLINCFLPFFSFLRFFLFTFQIPKVRKNFIWLGWSFYYTFFFLCIHTLFTFFLKKIKL